MEKTKKTEKTKKSDGCEKTLLQMSLYIDKKLSKNDNAAFEAHVNSCQNCAEELEAFQSMISRLNDMPQIDLPEGVHDQVIQQIRSLSQPIDLITKETVRKKAENLKNRVQWLHFRKYASVAAGIIVTFFVMSVVLSMLSQPLENNQSEQAEPLIFAGEPQNGADAFQAAPVSAAQPENINAMNEPAMPEAKKQELASNDNAVPSTFSITDSNETGSVTENLADADVVANQSMTAGRSVAAGNLTNEDYAIKSFNITIEAYDFNAALDTLNAFPGYNSFANMIYGDGQSGQSANVCRRVDASAYVFSKDVLRSLGKVLSENETEQKITYAVMDTNAAIAAKAVETQRLYTLLENSQSIEMMVAVEQQLARVEAQKDALTGQALYNASNVQSPSLNVTIVSKDDDIYIEENPTLTRRMKDAFSASMRLTVALMEWMLVTLSAVFVPLLVVVVIAFVCILFVKKGRRRDAHGK